MKTKFLAVTVLFLLTSLGSFWKVQAQPFIESSDPDVGATGVSPSAAVVFTFSEAMNPDPTATTVQFLIPSPFSILATSNFWSAGNTILTCTPTPAFPGNNTIYWTASGENPVGDPLSGSGVGFFSTGTGGGGGGTGSGTNQFTTFSVGKLHVFNQTSTDAPVLDSTVPYEFAAVTTLASNIAGSAVSLKLPTPVTTNLSQNPFQHELFSLFTTSTDLSSFDTTYPVGSYTFNVTAGSSNLIATANLLSATQPNAPHCANYTAAQSVDPTQLFLLGWDAFSGGTTSDFIFVDIGEVFRTPNPGLTGALNGTVTSVIIPANTLQANSNYDGTIGFYHATVISNATYTTIGYIGSVTHFSLITSTGAGITLRLTNSAWSSNTFSFDVLAPAGQTITAESSPTLQPNSWSSVLTTNVPAGGSVRIRDPHSVSNKFLFYHARTGS